MQLENKRKEKLKGDWELKLQQEGLGTLEHKTIIRPEEFTIFAEPFEHTKEELLLNTKILNEFRFKDEFERDIFRLYVEGKSYRQISAYVVEHFDIYKRTLSFKNAQKLVKRVQAKFGQKKTSYFLRKKR